jgi:hypothetical protein
MTLRIRRFAPVLLLAGGLGLAIGVGSVFDEALAEAGGNGKGIGQGAPGAEPTAVADRLLRRRVWRKDQRRIHFRRTASAGSIH